MSHKDKEILILNGTVGFLEGTLIGIRTLTSDQHIRKVIDNALASADKDMKEARQHGDKLEPASGLPGNQRT